LRLPAHGSAALPKCESEHLYYLGAGSEQGEEQLQQIFPGARIGRMDRDTVRGRGDLERLLARLHSGEINLLVGTQMIAKGHDITASHWWAWWAATTLSPCQTSAPPSASFS